MLERSERAALALRIEGRGVFLRPAALDDYPAWSDLRRASKGILEAVEPGWNDDDLTREAFEQRVSFEARAIAQGKGYPFLIFRHDGVLIGGLTIGPIVAKVALLGIWIGAPFTGRGYAIHATKAALKFAFNRLGLHRIDATVLPENLASIRAMEYLGFDPYQNTVIFNVAGKPREHRLYAVMR